MNVEVCYADAAGAMRIAVDLPAGSRVADALAASDAVARCGLDAATLGYGIFGRRADLDTALADGDRVELLRPLIVDPKEARRRRAAVRRARPVRAAEAVASSAAAADGAEAADVTCSTARSGPVRG